MSDFYPGLPYEADIIRDNESLGLPIYRICETVFLQDPTPPAADGVAEEDKPRKRVNVEATIANLVNLGALPQKIRRVSSRVAFLGRSTTYQNASLSLEIHQVRFNRKA